MRTLRRLHGSWTVARAIPTQRRAPWLDMERIAELRDRRVRSIVRFAAENVPHYRDAFRAHGLDPAEIRTAADLERLPLIAKEDVQRDPMRFVAGSRDGREALLFRTSGSSGMPLDVYHDRASVLANVAHSERERVVEARFCGKRVRYRVVGFGPTASATMRVQGFLGEATLRPVRPSLGHMTMDEPLERVVDELNRRRPDSLHGYGSYLEALFRGAEARGLRLEPPRVVVVAGDGITPAGKALIQERFAVPVIERYAAIESFKIAFTCEERGAYHLHEDLCHVRALGGELVISNLVNRGTVLLNYRIGDLGRLLEGACGCGRGLPLLAGVEGRASAVLELPNGALVHPIAVWGALRDQPGILRFQLVRHGAAAYELRLVTADARGFDRVAATAVPRLRALLDGAEVEPTRHDELRAGASGKFAIVVPLSNGAQPS